MNNMKAWLLMAALTAMLVLIGNLIGGSSGAMLFFLIAMALNFFTYFNSDKMAIKMTKSLPIPKHEAPELYDMVSSLSRRAGLPMPRLYRTPSPQPNAFATGRNPENSAVAVTDGLMQMLNRSEIEGVLAHELAHIKNRDVLVGTITATMAGAITMIANVLQFSLIFSGGNSEEGGGLLGTAATFLMAMLAPIAAMIIQMAISRSREYMADETGAQIAGSPQGLANALLKLEHAAKRVPMQVNPASSHLFIVNPLSGSTMARLFSTHPPIEDRVQRLKAM